MYFKVHTLYYMILRRALRFSLSQVHRLARAFLSLFIYIMVLYIMIILVCTFTLYTDQWIEKNCLILILSKLFTLWHSPLQTATLHVNETSISGSPWRFVGWNARNVVDISPCDLCSKFGNSSSSTEHLEKRKILTFRKVPDVFYYYINKTFPNYIIIEFYLIWVKNIQPYYRNTP